ncbi:MAG: hypothetical protein WA941_23590 [Nitrososphaeraceae archaeon]
MHSCIVLNMKNYALSLLLTSTLIFGTFSYIHNLSLSNVTAIGQLAYGTEDRPDPFDPSEEEKEDSEQQEPEPELPSIPEPESPSTPKIPSPAPVDSDGDGIPDDQDVCPDDPTNTCIEPPEGGAPIQGLPSPQPIPTPAPVPPPVDCVVDPGNLLCPPTPAPIPPNGLGNASAPNGLGNASAAAALPIAVCPIGGHTNHPCFLSDPCQDGIDQGGDGIIDHFDVGYCPPDSPGGGPGGTLPTPIIPPGDEDSSGGGTGGGGTLPPGVEPPIPARTPKDPRPVVTPGPPMRPLDVPVWQPPVSEIPIHNDDTLRWLVVAGVVVIVVGGVIIASGGSAAPVLGPALACGGCSLIDT